MAAVTLPDLTAELTRTYLAYIAAREVVQLRGVWEKLPDDDMRAVTEAGAALDAAILAITGPL